MGNVAALTRAELSARLHQAIGLSRAECGRLVDAVLEEIAAALARGDAVKLSGFGAFEVRARPPRAGRNPKSGVPVPIAPHRALGFRPSQEVRARIAGAPVPGGDAGAP